MNPLILGAAKAHLECMENDMEHLGPDTEESRWLDELREAIAEAEVQR